MKKLLLSLGAFASMTAPLATVVACGDEAKEAVTGGDLVKPEYDSSKQMLINDIAEYTHHSGQFGSSREDAIKGVWDQVKTEAKSADEVAAIIATAAYATEIEEDGWETTLAAVKVNLLGGTTEYGEVNGWAWAEAQRLQKDIIFANLEDTVAYVAPSEAESLDPGTSIDYVAKDGEILVSDWTEFGYYAGIGTSAEDAVNAVWDDIKGNIVSLQGLINYIAVYGYGSTVDSIPSYLAGNVNNYLKDYIAKNGVKVAFLDGTVIANDVVIAGGDSLVGSVVANTDPATNTVTLVSPTGVTLTTTADLSAVAEGSDITITATANPGYTVNGADTQDFTTTINAPAAIPAGATAYGFHDDDATAGEDHSALFEAVVSPGETDIKVYTKAGVVGAATSSNYKALKLGTGSNAGSVKYSNPGSTITKIEIVGAGWADTTLAIIGGVDFAGTNIVLTDMAKYNAGGSGEIGVTPGWSSTYTFDFSANPISEGSFLITTDKAITSGGHTSVVIEDIIVHTT